VRGEGSSGADPFDGIMVTCPEAMDLDLTVGIPATGFPEEAEFDILVYDLTLGEEDPPLLDYFVWGATGLEYAKGAVTVPAGSLIEILVYAYTGNANWSLAIRGLEATVAPTAVPAAQAGRGRPILAAGRVPPAFGPGPEFVPGEALVRFGQDACPPGGCRVVGAVGGRSSNLGFAVPPGLTAEEQRRFTLRTIACLNRREGIVYAEPNYVRRALAEPDDTYYNLQWHYPMINLPQAWDITTGDPGVIVAVIDTGVAAHPDLQGNSVPGYDFVSNVVNAADGNGIDADPTDPGEPGGFSGFHGTHVAGTIGARTNNGEGVAGVSWSGRLMHLRGLGVAGGNDADIANAILYAAGLPNSSGAVPAQRAHVINMSLGGAGASQTLGDAVADARDAGVVIFAASGNENTTEPSYPAAYDGVISVGAVDLGANRAPYSNFGSTLDLVAPGGDVTSDDNGDGYADGVLSTWVDDSEFPAFPWYVFYNGTSMACPHAAGVAALMLAVNPDLTPAEVEGILKSTAADLGAAGVDLEYGHGLIDAHAAVLAAQTAGMPPPVVPPVLSLSTAALVFDRDDTASRIRISNTGGGTLSVDPPTVILPEGESWLQAALVAGAGPASDASGIDVTVDRGTLVDGVYFGRVVVESNGGAQLVQVLMRVQALPPLPPSINITVRAVRVEDGTVAKEVVVNPASLDLTFRLEGLVAGDYRIEAGADLDGDGQFCEAGELCGAYPAVNYPLVIPLQEGEERGPFRFTVAPSGILPSSS
jgi:serine protease